jgi:hypothetical protein
MVFNKTPDFCRMSAAVLTLPRPAGCSAHLLWITMCATEITTANALDFIQIFLPAQKTGRKMPILGIPEEYPGWLVARTSIPAFGATSRLSRRLMHSFCG